MEGHTVRGSQALPDGARAVTLWPSQDEAFAEIAARLRERIYAQRLAATKPMSLPAIEPSSAVRPRVLDAAVASHIPVGEPADVVTMVRTTDSNGLKAILRLDASYNIPPENVQSKSFEVEFPRDAAGQVLPAALELILDSPGCDPSQQKRKLRVPPTGDSDVCVFLLTPIKAGRLMLNLEVRYEDVEVGSRLLVTEAGPSVAAASPYSLVSMPLTSTAAWSASLPGIQKAFAPSPPSPRAPASVAPAPFGVEQITQRMPGSDSVSVIAEMSRPQAARPQSAPQATGPSSAPGPQRKSWLTRPMMATAASAAALVVIGGVLLTTGPKSQAPAVAETAPTATTSAPPPATPSPAPAEPSGAGGSAHPSVETVTALRPSPQAAAPAAQAALNAGFAALQREDDRTAIGSFTRAIRQDPTNAELYWLRAEAYLRLKEPSLALRDLDQSIQRAPDAAYPHLLKAEILNAAGSRQQALREYRLAAATPSASPQTKGFAAKRAEQLQ